jgi:hypothetical protein
MLVMASIFPAILQQQPSHLPPAVLHAIEVGVIAVGAVLMVLLPAVFSFFYSRPSVKATCLALKGAQVPTPEAGAPPAPGLPIPLVILVVWQGFAASSFLVVLYMPATIVFGVVLRGAAAFLVSLAQSVLCGYSAWAIFRRKLIGWQIALFTTSFWTISWLVCCVRRPNLVELAREMGFGNEALGIYEQFPHFLPLISVASIAMMSALLVFLLYTRNFFPSEERG